MDGDEGGHSGALGESGARASGGTLASAAGSQPSATVTREVHVRARVWFAPAAQQKEA